MSLFYDSEEFLNEEKLSAAERKELKASAFGIPSKRAYPLHDKTHVIAAITKFKYCKPENKKELAKNIIKQAKKFKVEVHSKDVLKYAADAK